MRNVVCRLFELAVVSVARGDRTGVPAGQTVVIASSHRLRAAVWVAPEQVGSSNAGL